MIFWLSAAQVAARLDRLRVAENRLLAYATKFGSGNYKVEVLDTPIPRSVVPLVSHETDQVDLNCDEESYIMHSAKVTSDGVDWEKSSVPLVLVHGYMNGAAYFYRNLVGLSEKFSSVYSLDLLGWGLSSRPKYKLLSQSSEEQNIRTAEDFFVESLEAWRKQQNIATMVLAGHSMGGYISVAYAERYPERVEKLVLISPVGVPSDSASAEERIARARQQSLFFRALSTTWYYLFEWNHTVGGVLRTLSESRASKISSRYVERRLPAVSDSSEQEALSEYLVANSLLPGSGEYCVQSFLTSSLQGRMPTEQRIPHLRVPSVSFLYGSRDWMDINGGLRTEVRTEGAKPEVAVYSVSDAGHLLMLDNYKEFNAGIIEAAGLKTESGPSPERVHPTEKHYQTVEVVVQDNDIQGETVQPVQVVTP